MREERKARDARLHRIGCWWAAANLVLGGLGLAARLSEVITRMVMSLPAGADVASSLISLAALLVFFGAIGLIYGLDRELAARRMRGLHHNGVMLQMAALPWILWGLFSLLIRRLGCSRVVARTHPARQGQATSLFVSCCNPRRNSRQRKLARAGCTYLRFIPTGSAAVVRAAVPPSVCCP